eukprot:gnl/MRDRNA2_/MRDRNA2_34652_c0_seq1.p1 gnl/MRDRNA2_/MRDRNA2_34652_c0~~gnl/MRDRNA2_/MRDRNA2_34652_c0_seq1.p1  ORF type:complete len:563 (-),score=209.91 gnl/MRDRNA2_/MRDRNA2_34652_c0_seq1:225-1856(-)
MPEASAFASLPLGLSQPKRAVYHIPGVDNPSAMSRPEAKKEEPQEEVAQAEASDGLSVFGSVQAEGQAELPQIEKIFDADQMGFLPQSQKKKLDLALEFFNRNENRLLSFCYEFDIDQKGYLTNEEQDKLLKFLRYFADSKNKISDADIMTMTRVIEHFAAAAAAAAAPLPERAPTGGEGTEAPVENAPLDTIPLHLNEAQMKALMNAMVKADKNLNRNLDEKEKNELLKSIGLGPPPKVFPWEVAAKEEAKRREKLRAEEEKKKNEKIGKKEDLPWVQADKKAKEAEEMAKKQTEEKPATLFPWAAAEEKPKEAKQKNGPPTAFPWQSALDAEKEKEDDLLAAGAVVFPWEEKGGKAGQSPLDAEKERIHRARERMLDKAFGLPETWLKKECQDLRALADKTIADVHAQREIERGQILKRLEVNIGRGDLQRAELRARRVPTTGGAGPTMPVKTPSRVASSVASGASVAASDADDATTSALETELEEAEEEKEAEEEAEDEFNLFGDLEESEEEEEGEESEEEDEGEEEEDDEGEGSEEEQI